MSGIRNTFDGWCADCGTLGSGRATCAVNGTNAFGDREQRVVILCGPCRRKCRGRCILHPSHQVKQKGRP